MAKYRPDLILMDIQLPVMDGYEATRRIKADPSLSSIPIIAVTSYALSGDEAKARAAGCNDFVPKPYSLAASCEDLESIWIVRAAGMVAPRHERTLCQLCTQTAVGLSQPQRVEVLRTSCPPSRNGVIDPAAVFRSIESSRRKAM